MSEFHLHHNRPFHLARMVVLYEHCLDLVFRPNDQEDCHIRMRHADTVVRLLGKAAKHAQFSILTGAALEEEKEFLLFIQLNRQTALSVRSMLENECELKTEEGYISDFLLAAETDCEISAMHFKRRSNDLLQGLANMMRLAQGPYLSLKRKFYDSMVEEYQNRYDHCLKEFSEEFRFTTSAAETMVDQPQFQIT